jgi:putative membrane protein
MEQTDLIEAILNFAIYFGLSIVFLVLFKYVYTLITPHDEWQLIKDQQNISASIGFGGAIIGFAIAVAGAATNSVSVLDFITWTVIALIAQSLAFAILRFGFMPHIVQRIEQNEISAGVMLGAVNISIGLLNAACMSY